ncbi:DsbA family protein [Sphingopyxis sp. PET50]|uniref:DsbA family protein n=1 Tax=Sphingopyxis sp. PET50 TaxID=2976533 RepID=UPI0021AECF02|nr:thioredoxin domain-containing protein [Sphingopyxis sp. PET50]
MTDRKDDYYQPWLRDPAPAATPPAAAPHDAGADGGLAKPREAPPVGLDVSRYPAEEQTPKAPVVDRDRLKAGASGLWRAIRGGGSAFADWTIRVGEAADIPARVEAMEIPRRSRELAAKTAATTARAARAVGRGTARGSAAAAAASAQAWEKMALGEKVGKLSSEAQRGLGGVAGKAGEALGQAARAGKDSLGEAATKLRPAPRNEPGPPPSGLEQLLAREAQEEAAAPAATARPAAPDLPLFAGEPEIELAAPKAAPSRTAKAAAAVPPPSVSAPAPDERAPYRPAPPPRGGGGHGTGGHALPAPAWALALGAILLLGAAFWLGGRFAGGLSKSEVETVVADYIKANPQIIPEAFDAQRDREMAKAIAAIRPALEKPYAGAWAGNADGDVTLTVFTDYACGFCRASLPDLDRLIRSDRRLKVVFRELPIIAPQSRDAAIMALAAARQGKYDAFHHAMFAAPSLDAAGIAAAAEKAGVVTDGSADATANEALFQREIDSNLAIARQLQLNATPTWVVGDQLLQGQIGYDMLKQAVARARAKG